MKKEHLLNAQFELCMYWIQYLSKILFNKKSIYEKLGLMRPKLEKPSRLLELSEESFPKLRI